MKKTLFALFVLLLLPVSAWALATRASKPTVYVTDTDNPPTVFLAGDVTVCSGGGCTYTTIQAAINAAILANSANNFRITVTAGQTFTECIKLASNNSTPARTNFGWIYIRSSAEASLPPRHVRLGCRATTGCTAAQLTADDANLFEIQYCGDVNGTAITSGWVSNNGPEYIWMRGFKILLGTGVSANNHLISLSTQGGTEPTLVGQVASHIVFEQIHMESIAGQNARFSRGCWCNGYYIAVVDSVIGRFASPGGVDSQTIIMTKGGPLKVVNNDLFSASEVLAVGDSNPSFPVTGDSAFNEPHDIEIRYNKIGVKLEDMNCPALLVPGTTRNANLPEAYLWPLKNLFEHKQAVREWIDSNYFYNYQNQYDQHWAFAFQNGNPDITTGAANGDAEDIIFTNNVLYGYSAIFQMLGSDFQVTSNKEKRVLVENNAFIDQRRAVWTPTGNNCAAEDETRGSHQFLWANGYYTKSYSPGGSNVGPLGLYTTGVDSTTLVADPNGFQMFYWNWAAINQVVHITSGTNFVAGDYTIQTLIDPWTVTLDRSPSTPGTAATGGTGYANVRSSVGGPDDLIFNHNLFYKMPNLTNTSPTGTGTITYFDIGGWSPSATSNRFEYTNNITAVGNYGFWSSVNGVGNEFCTTILERVFPNASNSYLVTGNTFVVDNGTGTMLPGSPCNTDSIGSFTTNYWPNSWANVGFAYVPPDASQIDSTFNLTTTSTCTANADVYPMTMASGGLNASGCATDGKNPGPDMNVLVHQVNFARMGIQPSAMPAIAATTGAGLSATAAKGGSGYAPNLMAH